MVLEYESQHLPHFHDSGAPGSTQVPWVDATPWISWNPWRPRGAAPVEVGKA